MKRAKVKKKKRQNNCRNDEEAATALFAASGAPRRRRSSVAGFRGGGVVSDAFAGFGQLFAQAAPVGERRRGRLESFSLEGISARAVEAFLRKRGQREGGEGVVRRRKKKRVSERRASDNRTQRRST